MAIGGETIWQPSPGRAPQNGRAARVREATGMSEGKVAAIKCGFVFGKITPHEFRRSHLSVLDVMKRSIPRSRRAQPFEYTPKRKFWTMNREQPSTGTR